MSPSNHPAPFDALRTNGFPQHPRLGLGTLAGWATGLVLPALYAWVLARHLAFLQGITNPHFFEQVERALAAAPLTPGPVWESAGWSGLGWALRTGVSQGWTADRIGQALSVVGGSAGLLGVFIVARGGGLPFWSALGVQLLVAAGPGYLSAGGVEGGWLPAAGTQFLGMGLLTLAVRWRRWGRVLLAVAGAALVISAAVLGGRGASAWIESGEQDGAFRAALAALVGLGVGWLGKGLWRSNAGAVPLASPVPLALLLGVQVLASGRDEMARILTQPRLPEVVVAVSDRLRGAGLQEAREALSSEAHLQDLGDPYRRRYAALDRVPRESTAALVEGARNGGYRFLVFGPDGQNSAAGLAQLGQPETRPAGLIPLYRTADLAVYRFAPEIPPPPPVHIQFERGIGLDGVRVGSARRAGEGGGWVLGVYLRWAPQQAVADPYRVVLQLVEPDQRVVASSDEVPAAGAYPTTEWRAGETLIDFHALVVPDGAPELTMLVRLYREGTGELLRRLDPSGEPGGDAARVGTLTLDGGLRFRPTG